MSHLFLAFTTAVIFRSSITVTGSKRVGTPLLVHTCIIVMIYITVESALALYHGPSILSKTRKLSFRRPCSYRSVLQTSCPPSFVCFVLPISDRTAVYENQPRRNYSFFMQTNSNQSNRQQDNELVPSNQGNKRRRQNSSAPARLQPPEIIFSNNHLLVVNKGPGWKSQPGEGYGTSSSFDQKCLLTYLQNECLGGGSQQTFLTPTHRLDQPCSGVLIFAKNKKAASRVQVAWSKKQVEKCYWVVVEGGMSDKGGKMGGLELLQSRSSRLSKGAFSLSAIVQNKGRSNNDGNGSVSVKPVPPSNLSDAKKDSGGRICNIEWRHLLRLPDSEFSCSRHLLSVKTDTGAKHQVRALLAIAGGAPIAGDLRYGNKILNVNQDGGRVRQPLPDQSVALHARTVFLPSVSLGGMEFLKEEPFVADIPTSWTTLFGITEKDKRRCDQVFY